MTLLQEKELLAAECRVEKVITADVETASTALGSRVEPASRFGRPPTQPDIEPRFPTIGLRKTPGLRGIFENSPQFPVTIAPESSRLGQ